jgi:hypothetical protein
MKKVFSTTIIVLSIFVGLNAQNGVGIGTSNPNANAILDVKSNSKGLLIPRMLSTQRESMALGVTDRGMIVYDGTLNQFMFFNGTAWKGMSTDTSLWQINGTDVFRGAGKVGVGTDNPLSKFHLKNDDGTIAARIENTYTGAATSYSLLLDNKSENTNDRYGIMSRSYGSPNGGDLFAVYGKAIPQDENMDAYGGYFFVDSTGSGTHYGLYTEASGIGNYGLYAKSGTSDAWAAYLDGRVTIKNRLGVGTDTPEGKVDILSGNKLAVQIQNSSESTDTIYGIDLLVDSLSGSPRYGIHNLVIPSLSSTTKAYGIFSKVEPNGTGLHFGLNGVANGDDNIGVRGKSSGTGIGVKGVNTDGSGYAGYFDGNGYIHDRLEIRDKIFLRPVGNGDGGEIELFDNDGDQTVTIRAGQTTDNGAELLMYNDDGDKTIELDADWGTGKGRVITDELQITGGSDLAENFNVEHHDINILPGMVVCIDPNTEGGLKLSEKAYDKTVVGVISGANGVDPGMLMGQKASIADGDWPIALAGRVYVKADASRQSIHPGDLLTSASLPGHAMVASKQRKAQGAILGKALTALDSGTGYVLILVNLR